MKEAFNKPAKAHWYQSRPPLIRLKSYQITRIAIIFGCLVSLLYFWQHRVGNDSPEIQVCLIGNTNAETAQEIHNRWGFPSVFASQEFAQDTSVIIIQGKEKTWSRNVYEAYRTAQKTYDCDYYFVHDGLPTTPRYVTRSETISRQLVDFLNHKKPAVVGFQGNEMIQPLSELDARLSIYHKDVVRLFFSHENNFDHVQMSAFVSAFAPRIFGKATFTLNMFESVQELDSQFREIYDSFNRFGNYEIASAVPHHYRPSEVLPRLPNLDLFKEYVNEVATADEVRQFSKPVQDRTENDNFKLVVKIFTEDFDDLKGVVNTLSKEHLTNAQAISFEVHYRGASPPREYISQLRLMDQKVTMSSYPKSLPRAKCVQSIWKQPKENEFIMFIDSQFTVSLGWLGKAMELVKRYTVEVSPGLKEKLIGFSLYLESYSDVLKSKVDLQRDPFLYQMVPSHGGVFFPDAWQNFVEYAQGLGSQDAYVPDSMTNAWSMSERWEKAFLRFIVEKGLVFLYPGSSGQWTFQPLDNMHIYNYKGNETSLDKLALRDGVASFDSCTLIMMVYSRTKTIRDRLRYYQNLECLSAIVIVWSNLDVQPPTADDFKVPVHILVMAQNTLNDRFYPHSVIKTDCIISMDDDYDFPFDQLLYMVAVWRGNFFDHMVGTAFQGRNHFLRDGQYLYSPTVWYANPNHPKDRPKFYSMLLPSGSVYHRKWLALYSRPELKSARAIVDQMMNCEDILFSFMIANATGNGPVIIDGRQELLDFGLKGGLWMRPSHARKRSEAINHYVEFYGYMPLKYTTNIFSMNQKKLPVLEDLDCQEEIPYDYPCLKDEFDSKGICQLTTTSDQVGGFV